MKNWSIDTLASDTATNAKISLCGTRLVAGTSVELEGTLVKSLGKEQALELQVSNMKVIGSCDAEVKFSSKAIIDN